VCVKSPPAVGSGQTHGCGTPGRRYRGIPLLVAAVAGSGFVSSLVSGVMTRAKSRTRRPRIEFDLEHADGTSTTAVLEGADEQRIEALIRALEKQAAEGSAAEVAVAEERM